MSAVRVGKRSGAAAKKEPLSAEMLESVAAQFRALSETARLGLLQILCDGPRSVGELADATGLSHANASKHLSVLAAAGFVARRKDGVKAVYAVADESPQALCEVICERLTRRANAAIAVLRSASGRPPG